MTCAQTTVCTGQVATALPPGRIYFHLAGDITYDRSSD
jgi:hypothetical protein